MSMEGGRCISGIATPREGHREMPGETPRIFGFEKKLRDLGVHIINVASFDDRGSVRVRVLSEEDFLRTVIARVLSVKNPHTMVFKQEICEGEVCYYLVFPSLTVAFELKEVEENRIG